MQLSQWINCLTSLENFHQINHADHLGLLNSSYENTARAS
jgi:hypothetical protein